MIFERFYDEKLAQASYLVGCLVTGDALVIDPNRYVEQYVRFADAAGLRITAVTETHIHADYVSGSRELAARSGAMLYLSDEGGVDWTYQFAANAGTRLLRDGDSFMVGNLKLEVLHTPGHTPEHISFILADTAATDQPMGVFTGDFVFVGDVGRPDLLEKAAKIAGTQEPGARTLFQSLQRFKQLPDYLQIWPGHGAGSACGKGLSAVPQSTIGYERIANWAFGYENEDDFVQDVLSGQPEPPKYFAQMKRINKEGPSILDGSRRPERLEVERLIDRLSAGALVVDTRPASEFAEGHIPGTLNIPLDNAFVTWAGWLLPYDAPFYLLINEERPALIDQVSRDLAEIGLDHIAGYNSVRDLLTTWTQSGQELARIPQVTADEVAGSLADEPLVMLDVRGRSEWDEGHLPDGQHIPLGYLTDHLTEIPRDRQVVVYCQGGARSAIAASLLRANGIEHVVNLQGGIEHWRAAGMALTDAA